MKKRRNITISELTREATDSHLVRATAGRRGRSDVSERIEEILAAEVPSCR